MNIYFIVPFDNVRGFYKEIVLKQITSVTRIEKILSITRQINIR